jgi:hypothetical protein
MSNKRDQVISFVRNNVRYVPLGIIGSLLGCLLALIVGTTLVEVTFSAIFAIVFGMVLEALAVIIVFRAVTTSVHDNVFDIRTD